MAHGRRDLVHEKRRLAVRAAHFKQGDTGDLGVGDQPVSGGLFFEPRVVQTYEMPAGEGANVHLETRPRGETSPQVPPREWRVVRVAVEFAPLQANRAPGGTQNGWRGVRQPWDG